jgi:formylmethanofuran dehydrogenase subunit C
LTPDRLIGLDRAAVAAIELSCANRRATVADFFDVSGEDAADLRIEGACARLDRIGAGMTQGRITVAGDSGDYLGLGMAGGRIEVEGSCGSHAACEMRNGFIRIGGDAGDFVGAALVGSPAGMRGGTVLVGGNAGDRAGDRMRRGMLLVEGDAGAYCASRMLAGTIAVLGQVGSYPGFAMRRGTLLARKFSGGLLSSFNDCGAYELAFLRLLFKEWRRLPGPFGQFGQLADAPIRVRRHMGDRGNAGKGEILLWDGSQSQ